MSTKLNGKTALILGGTSGMGLAAARLFLDEGARVVITGRKQEKIEAAKNELSGEFEIYQADIGDYEATRKAIEQGVGKFGKLDVLYQVGGIGNFAPFAMANQEHYETMVNVDLMGPIMAMLHSREHLNDNASIIFTTTTASTRPMPMMSAYAAAKAGLNQFAKVLALELAERNIRVNAISPGATDTPVFNEIGMPEDQVTGFKQFFTMITPLKRMGTPEDIANAALFLASDDSSQITGITLEVDGGLNQSWHLQPGS